jgi:hypothetical protein
MVFSGLPAPKVSRWQPFLVRINTEDVLLSCPGLFDPHTGEPVIPTTGDGSVLMLLPA